MLPIINDGPYKNKNWKMVWNDEFNGNSLNKDKWRIEKILPDFQGNNAQMSQHVTNTFGFDTQGNRRDGEYPHGKRHAVWYDKHHDKTIEVKDGALYMGFYRSDEDDPTIKSSHHPYTNPRNGDVADFRKKIYTSWLDTYAMSWHDGAVRPARQDSPNFYFRYGFVEVGVNFEQTNVEGGRNSVWLLPAVDPIDEDRSLVGGTYDDSAANGLECDIFEYEPSPGAEHFLLCKNIGANSKKIPPVDCRKFGIDITKGDHTIAVYWDNTVTIWYVDGIEVARDDVAIVHIAMALYLTREGNSAAGGGDGIAADPPYIQRDAGLWGYNIGTMSNERLETDKSAILYVRVYQNEDQEGNWLAPNWRDLSGVEDSDEVIVSTVTTPSKPVDTTTEANDSNDFNITIDGNIMRWNDVNKDSKYDIKFNDNVYTASMVGTEWTIPEGSAEGEYYVTSTPDGGPFINSEKVVYKIGRSDIIKPEVMESEEVKDDGEESTSSIIKRIIALLMKLLKRSDKD